MSMRTALTGLNAATSDLGVISNNIANNNTTGFKTSRAEFADIYAGSKIGAGVKLAAVTQQFTQGNITGTGNALDMAVDGEGFFRVSDQKGISYTRAGSFGVDKDGYVVNNQSQRLTGFQADDQGKLSQVLGDLRVPTGELQPSGTRQAGLGSNLDAEADSIPAATTFSITDPSSYNYSTSLAIFDSLGGSHTLTTYFRKSDTADNSWDLYGSLNGDVLDSGASLGTLEFDAGGLLTSASSIDIPLPAPAGTNFPGDDGATPVIAEDTIRLGVNDITQFGGQFSTSALSQDGYSSGRLGGVDVGNDGTIFGRYSNGQSKALGQVALVNFRNVQGLSPIGDTNWVETAASGAAVPGAPGTASLGQVRSGSLESSSVELTEQLVSMINAQRNFQANAQVVSTNSDMTQTILNLR